MGRRAFSLVELLTVIAIIALVISIILPVLSGARETGKQLASQRVLSDIASASGRFKLDHQGRNPGYFSEREMGSDQNDLRGMSGMENAMLDLAGDNAIVAGAGAGIIEVGPTAASTVFVNPSLIGTDKGAYYTPSREYYEAQLNSSGQQIASVAGHAGSTESDPQLLDIVDAFGSPVLFWSADSYTVPQVNVLNPFAKIQAVPNGNPALFYWNSNAAFLRAPALGRKGYDHTIAPAPGVRASLLGAGAEQSKRLLTMSGVLGSASEPRVPPDTTVDQVLASPSATNIERLFPGRGRGAFVLQSAGIDAVFVSSKDKGFSTIAHEGDHIEYGLSFFASESARLTDDQGNPTSRDVMAEFDDVIVAGGG